MEPVGAHDGLPFELGVFDLDGTVLRRDLVISEETMEALQDLRKLGMRLVVATGRHFESAREHAGRLGFDGEDPLVCYGGAMVRRMNGETLLHRTAPFDASVEVLEWAQERGIHTRLFTDGSVVTAPDPPVALSYLRRSEEPNVSVVEDTAAWLRDHGEEPTKLVLVDRPDGVDVWLDDAREGFSGRLFVTRSLPHYVEVGNPEGKKSRALEFLCGFWGIDPGRTLAFGDADNDVDMLRFAGRGVAVGETVDALREAADEVVPPVDEDGVAFYIRKLLEDL